MARVDGYLNFDTRIDTTGFNKGSQEIAEDAQKTVGSMLKRIAALAATAFSVKSVVDFGKSCVSTATEVENAWVGLNSIINGQGKSFNNAKNFIQKYVSDGLVPLNNAITAYKNLTLRGYNEEQIEAVMNSLKNSATYARQSQYSLGDAISSATEGLKNENSIVVDNAGVTKNVAKMWEDYAEKIGVSTTSLTKEQKIQAEVNGILEETKFQMGDAAKYSNTYSGQLARLNAAFTNLKAKIGNIVKVFVGSFLPVINAAISSIGKLVDKFTVYLNKMGIKTDIVDTLDGVDGFSSGGMKDLSSAAENAADNIGQAADETEKLKRQLALFDELNVLEQPDNTTSSDITIPDSNIDSTLAELGDTTATIGVDIDTSKADVKLSNLLEKVKSIFANLFEPLKEAWNKNNLGEKVIQSVINSAKSLLSFLKTIGSTFREVWNDGTGVRIWTNILNIVKNISDIIGTFFGKLKRAWKKNDTGRKIWKNILGIVEELTGFFEDLSEITLDWLERLDLYPAVSSFENLTGAVRDLVKSVNDKLKTVYEKILLPLAKWTIEKIVPKTVDALATALSAVAGVVDKISEGQLMGIASALSGIGTAILVFKAGQAIANGIRKISDGIEKLGSIVSANSVLAIAGIIAGITTALIEYNRLEWNNSEVGQFSAEIDRIKDDLQMSAEGINDALQNTKKALDNVYADNTLIDDYQTKLNQLLEAGTLDESEQAELKTIVSYFSDNVDGFDEVWGRYISISDNGKVELKGDLTDIQKEINNTIDSFQKMSNIKAIQELYTSNTKQIIISQMELNEVAESVRTKQEEVNEVYEEWQKARENGSPDLADLHDKYTEESQILEELNDKYDTTSSDLNGLVSENKNLQDILGVLNGDFSDASAVLTAYNTGMIDMKDVTENGYKSLKDLQTKSEVSGNNIVSGAVAGIKTSQGELVKTTKNLATAAIAGFNTAANINSPSKEMEKSGNYLVQGLIVGVNNNKISVITIFRSLYQRIKEVFSTLPNWFESIFATAWQNVKDVFSKNGTVFTGIKEGILSELKSIINMLIDGINEVIFNPFNALNSALDGIKGFGIDGFHPFWGLPNIDIPQIPHLARGTVVPANYGEFLAVLGDNKREREFVTPESAMTNAMINALRAAGIPGGNNDGDIVIVIDGREIFRVTKKEADKYKRTHGKPAFT